MSETARRQPPLAVASTVNGKNHRSVHAQPSTRQCNPPARRMAASGSRFARPRAAVIDTVQSATRAPSPNMPPPPAHSMRAPPPSARACLFSSRRKSLRHPTRKNLPARTYLPPQISSVRRVRPPPPLSRDRPSTTPLPARRPRRGQRARRAWARPLRARPPRRRAYAVAALDQPFRRPPRTRHVADRSAAAASPGSLQHGPPSVAVTRFVPTADARPRRRICLERGTACAPLTAAGRLTSVVLYV